MTPGIYSISDRDRLALGQRIPLYQLVPLAGITSIPLDLITTPVKLEPQLKRMVAQRIHDGEVCMVPLHQHGRGDVPKVDMGAFWRRHGEGGA